MLQDSEHSGVCIMPLCKLKRLLVSALMFDNTMPVQDLMPVAFASLAVAIAIYATLWYLDPLNAIPAVGSSSLPGLSYFAMPHNVHNLKTVIEEGYKKYPESTFKVALPEGWLVLVSGRRMVEELRKRPEEELSVMLGTQETLQAKYSLEPPLVSDDYLPRILKEHFTARKLPETMLDVVDEIAVAIERRIAVKDNEWTSVLILPTMQNITAQASNRAFVGLPLCRNDDYLAQAIDFTVHLMKDAMLLRLFPEFMKSFIAPLLGNVKHSTSRALLHLQPVIEERRKIFSVLGEGWNDKPNDTLQLILDKAIRKSETPTVITQRLLSLNFASIHTTSSTITHAIYHLAEEPDLLVPLRQEIEASIAADGWTTTALGRMWKLDSVLREVLRHYGIGLVMMKRIAAKDVMLCDGTRIPKGTAVCAAAHPLHHDDATLENASTFDPFRYARMRSAAADGDGLKHQSTTTSSGYIPFGHGPHACPGRYFASYEMKAILAHIILKYDFKLGEDGVRPAELCFKADVVPALEGRVLFKKRGTFVRP